MDVIELLKADHDKVNGIFQQFQMGGGSQEFRQLFGQLYQELSLHALAEENAVYPALAKFNETVGKVKDVYEDHADVKAAFAELAAMDNTSTEWSHKMTKLMEDVQAHVRKEEDQIFPLMRQRLSIEQLNMLGEEVQKAKQLSMPAVMASMPMKELGFTQQTQTPGMQQQFDGSSTQYAQ